MSGLDNPRQLAWDNNGRLLVAEAGHGSYGKPGTCFNDPEGKTCVGRSGKVSRIAHPAKANDRKPNRIARHFLSAAAPDGTFGGGSDGVDQGPLGKIYVQETRFPPDLLRRRGISAHQNGKLLGIDKSIVANISAYEFRHNPDGENVDSNPYAVLALRGHQLVADAASDDILRVNNGNGHVSVWATLPGDTAKFDPVPTSLARGRTGNIYVGTLYSLAPHKARVLRYSPSGKLLRSWHHFTSVTGVAAGRNGHIYVSELFAGCPQGPSQGCIPGRVVDLAPNGTRSRMHVPWPAGIAWRNGHLYVSAWSIAPPKGAFGIPRSSGQVWRIG
ncbi:MAG: ScyD/ScyE family protein [Propionibacteriales bacterium]|nr:ScyD/ScyE family protein [Propionibacteriales bacterium]